ncbi:hypothetical protein [Holdemanella biformis]|uniref:hypothetical protein n=1 Tax=Holdemanella biformis TaxID=1735 RepID=UPI00242A76F6|nr:hypothetical protein [Holdemanella biformis]MBS6258767.1 hypothetical protein [Holdemanella biformis]
MNWLKTKYFVFLFKKDVIIFDEPTSSLDKNARDVFLKNIDDLKENHIIIIITHDIELVNRLNSSVFCIERRGSMKKSFIIFIIILAIGIGCFYPYKENIRYILDYLYFVDVVEQNSFYLNNVPNFYTKMSIPLSEVHAIRYRSPHNPLKKSIFFKS